MKTIEEYKALYDEALGLEGEIEFSGYATQILYYKSPTGLVLVKFYFMLFGETWLRAGTEGGVCHESITEYIASRKIKCAS